MGSGLKVFNLGQILAQMKEKLYKVIPSYTKKCVYVHCHKITTKLLKVPKIQ